MDNKLSIDISKLQFVKITSEGWISQCPACFENGEDKHGRNHLSIMRNGVFNCSKYSGDTSHNKRILQLSGANIDINSTDYIAPQKQEPRVVMNQSWNIEILKGLVKNYDYWNNRGISSQTCEKFKIGVAYKGQQNFRSVIPILDKNNPSKIIGFNGRALNNDMKPKWKILGSKSDFLFPALDEEIERANKVILLESIGDALSLYENGIKNTLVLFGVNISSKQMGYLIKMNPSKIIISTNNDSKTNSVGNDAANKLSKTLRNYFDQDKIAIVLPNRKDWGEETNFDKLKNE